MASAMEETDLNNLLINAEQLALNPEENIEELPKIERTLKQVYDATNELWSRLTSEGLKDNEALVYHFFYKLFHGCFLLFSWLTYSRNLLLSTRGVDLSHLSHQLERITARRSLHPLDPTPVTDIDAFLRNELENSILSIVEYTSQSVNIRFRLIQVYLSRYSYNLFIFLAGRGFSEENGRRSEKIS